MTVSELARRAGVTADTVRHYTRSGLLAPIRDESNGYNCYSSGDLARLLFIRKARLLGFSVGDVRDILKESSHVVTLPVRGCARSWSSASGRPAAG